MRVPAAAVRTDHDLAVEGWVQCGVLGPVLGTSAGANARDLQPTAAARCMVRRAVRGWEKGSYSIYGRPTGVGAGEREAHAVALAEGVGDGLEGHWHHATRACEEPEART